MSAGDCWRGTIVTARIRYTSIALQVVVCSASVVAVLKAGGWFGGSSDVRIRYTSRLISDATYRPRLVLIIMSGCKLEECCGGSGVGNGCRSRWWLACGCSVRGVSTPRDSRCRSARRGTWTRPRTSARGAAAAPSSSVIYEHVNVWWRRRLRSLPTRSSAVAERPRDASCYWIFRQVIQGHYEWSMVLSMVM